MNAENQKTFNELTKIINDAREKIRLLEQNEEKEYLAERKADYDENVQGKLFLTIGRPYNGGDSYKLMRPFKCASHHQYNSCSVLALEFTVLKDELLDVSFGVSAHRVDSLTPKELLTTEKIAELKTLVHTGVEKMFSDLTTER